MTLSKARPQNALTRPAADLSQSNELHLGAGPSQYLPNVAELVGNDPSQTLRANVALARGPHHQPLSQRERGVCCRIRLAEGEVSGGVFR